MSTDDASQPLRQPQAWEVIVYGGALVGLLDAANASGFWYLYRGVMPGRIFQSIASGFYGKSAFAGGAPMAWLGAGLHFFIAASVAAVYCLGCRLWPRILLKPVPSGIIYGGIVFVVMNYVVIPLSNAKGGHPVLLWWWFDFLGHLFLIGLPVAFIARWSARKRARRANESSAASR